MLTPDNIRYENGVKICEKLMPDGTRATKNVASYVKAGALMKPNIFMDPIGITIHNTEDLKNVHDDAEQYTRATYNGNMGGVIVHYYVDDVGAWQILRENEPGWHAADGSGDGNRRTIAIECIMNGTGSKEDLGARDNAARLIAAIMTRFGWNISNLYTHNHWMKQPDSIVPGVRKNCPIYLLPKYSEFKALVSKYLNADITNQTDNISENKDTTIDKEVKFDNINVGDTLYFKGSTQYISSGNSAKSSKAKAGTVKVTLKASANAAHPIHVRTINTEGEFISGTYGWVNLSDLSYLSNTPATKYLVKVTASALNIRSGPSTSYKIVGTIRDKGIYTIVEVNNGWGKLESNLGWISLAYTNRL